MRACGASARADAWLYDNEQGSRILNALAEISAAHPGTTLGQVALNWVLRRRGVTSVIIGVRDEAQLRDNLAAATWALSDAEVALLDTMSQLPSSYPASHYAYASPGRNPPLFPRYRTHS
jgi:aryl-alcohol dehydrogenase-like predicted oxidoreductase